MILEDMVKMDLDYFEDISNAQEIIACKDALVGDILLAKRLAFGKSANEYMGPVTDIERYAEKRLRDMYGYDKED